MKMTPLHAQVKGTLMPVLLETTQKAREYRDKIKKPNDEVYKKMEAIVKSKLSRDQISENMMKVILDLIGTATGRPDLINIAKSSGSYAPLDPFTVIIPTELTKDALSYGLVTGLPYLVLHGIDKVLLAPDAHLVENAYDTQGQYKSFPANDLEVEALLDNLTPAQLRYILSAEMFAPFLEPIFGGDEEEEGSEVEPPNPPVDPGF